MLYPYLKVMIEPDQANILFRVLPLFFLLSFTTNDRTRCLIQVARAVVYHGFRSASARFILRLRSEDRASFSDNARLSPDRSVCR